MSNTDTTNSNSVLAHVVLGGSLMSEPAATQALTFILDSSKDIARSFLSILREANIEFEPEHIKAELGHGDSRPDLTIYDSDGHVRIFIENKFWAGLTDAQPVSYLRNLPKDPPSALVFIVPEQRVFTVWNELKKRCEDDKELKWVDGRSEHSVIWAEVDGKTMLVTSWKNVLEGLLDAADSGGHDATRQDIRQLRGLTDQMDAEAFLPLRADEVTDQEVARRLINYSDLIEEITDKLVSQEIADTKGLKSTHGYYTAGRYLRVRGKFGLWLGIELKVWRDVGITPLWWRADYINKGFSGVAGHSEKICAFFDDVKDYKDGYLYIPIRLKTGVERDRVIDDAVTQMTLIADKLLKEFPEN